MLSDIVSKKKICAVSHIGQGLSVIELTYHPPYRDKIHVSELRIISYIHYIKQKRKKRKDENRKKKENEQKKKEKKILK